MAVAVDETDNPWLRAWSNEDLAAVLERGDSNAEARTALDRALAIWEQKRSLPCADRIRVRLEALPG